MTSPINPADLLDKDPLEAYQYLDKFTLLEIKSFLKSQNDSYSYTKPECILKILKKYCNILIEDENSIKKSKKKRKTPDTSCPEQIDNSPPETNEMEIQKSPDPEYIRSFFEHPNYISVCARIDELFKQKL